MICGGGVEWAAHRTSHDVLALGFIFASNILKDADVAVGPECPVGHRQYGTHVRAVVARQSLGRVVRSTREYDGRVAGPFGKDDDGVEFHAIAHGNHDLTLDINVGRSGSSESLRDIARLLWGGGEWRGGDRQ